MSSRACPKCFRDFKYPSTLKRHLARKTPCAPVLTKAPRAGASPAKPYQCKSCRRYFTSSNGLSQHIRLHCKAQVGSSVTEAAARARISELESLLRAKGAESTELAHTAPEAVVAPLQQQASAVQGMAQATGSHATAIGQQQNIIINVFGQEDHSFLSRDFITKILDRALKVGGDLDHSAAMALRQTATEMFANHKRPENTSCCMVNEKVGRAAVNRGKLWEPMPISDLEAKLIDRVVTAIVDHQPVEGVSYTAILRRIIDNEDLYKQKGGVLTSILIHCKAILRMIERLPRL